MGHKESEKLHGYEKIIFKRSHESWAEFQKKKHGKGEVVSDRGTEFGKSKIRLETVKVDCFATNLMRIGLFHLLDLALVSPNRRQLAKGLITNM